MQRIRDTSDCPATTPAVQSKDNVKYLCTLDKFLEPLSSDKLAVVTDALPALMNAVKMVYTVSRYYNTTERMTSLFIKVTNQVCVELCCSLLFAVHALALA